MRGLGSLYITRSIGITGITRLGIGKSKQENGGKEGDAITRHEEERSSSNSETLLLNHVTKLIFLASAAQQRNKNSLGTFEFV